MYQEIKLKNIYDAALKVFSLYGYKKATLEDIAAELGWTKGALYQYANGKKDLYEKSVRHGLLMWQNKVKEEISSVNDISFKFEVMCKKAFKYLISDTKLKAMLILDPDIFPLSFQKDPYKEINNESIGLMKEILDQGIKEGKFRIKDTELLSKILFSIYKMLIIETYVLEEQDSNSVFDMAVEVVTRGFYNA